jgi:hypothetical protein
MALQEPLPPEELDWIPGLGQYPRFRLTGVFGLCKLSSSFAAGRSRLSVNMFGSSQAGMTLRKVGVAEINCMIFVY